MKSQYTKILKNSHASNHHTWVCSLCYPFALEIGSIYGCGSLIYMMNHPLDTLAPKEYGTGKFAMLSGQGHRDDEIVIFDEKPTVEYYGEFKLLDYKPIAIKMDIDSTMHMYHQAVEYMAYDKNKCRSFEFFLIGKIDAMIKRWEKKNGTVETFYKTFVAEREVYLKERLSAQKVIK